MNEKDADKKQNEVWNMGPQWFCPHIKSRCREDCKYIVKPIVEGKFMGYITFGMPSYSDSEFIVTDWDCSWGSKI